MNEKAHILVVDDDAEIRDLVAQYLSEEGFRVSSVADGDGMRKILVKNPADVVLLDIRLPKEDGLSLAAELRQQCDAGIIMLSQKNDVVDRVAGLEVGADDYVSKPFHLRELLARIRSVLRRREEGSQSSETREHSEPRASLVRFAGWELDTFGRTLVSPSNEKVELTSGEFDLLLAFVEHPNRVLNRDQLLDMARNREATLFDRSVDVQVGRLRRKIETDPRRPRLIKTIRGAGYMFAAEVKRR